MDNGVVGGTEARSALGHRVQHRLNVRGGTTDDAEDLTRRCLPLQGLGQLAIACVEFIEEAHVLDGDDRLVGEGLEERDLLVGERVDLSASELEDADRRALPQQWNAQKTPMAHAAGDGTGFRKLLDLSLNVRHMNGSTLQHGAPADGAPHDRDAEAGD